MQQEISVNWKLKFTCDLTEMPNSLDWFFHNIRTAFPCICTAKAWVTIKSKTRFSMFKQTDIFLKSCPVIKVDEGNAFVILESHKMSTHTILGKVNLSYFKYPRS